MNNNEERYIWLDGKICHLKDAKINVLSPTSQFGLNVFEGIPCYWDDESQQLFAFRLRDHFNRLLKSALLLELEHNYSINDFKEAFTKAIIANDFKENISVRQTLFVDGFGNWASSSPCKMFVSPISKAKTSSEYNKNGLKCCVTSWRRISENSLSPRIKCGANYINSRHGQREALRNGYDTCIFLNEFGKVSEGPGSCLFIVKDNTFITPILSDSVLESITRDTVLQLCAFLGFKCEQRTIDRTELYTCDSAFLCGSAMEIKQLVSIDGHHFSENQLISQLQLTYSDVVRGKIKKFKNWVTPIYKK